MHAVIGVSKGVFMFEALLSTIARLREEYGVTHFTLVTTSRSRDFVETSKKRIEESLPELLEGVTIDIDQVCDWTVDENCNTELQARDLLKLILKNSPGEEMVVSFTPSSRRLASAISIASGTILCDYSLREKLSKDKSLEPPLLRIVHVDFLFGPWERAAYPYVPRPLEPVIEIIATRDVEESLIVNTARKAPRLEQKQPNRDETAPCRLPWGPEIGRLRCAVFELARRFNSSSDTSILIRKGRHSCQESPGVIEIAVESELLNTTKTYTIENYCDPNEFKVGVKKFARETCNLLDELWDALEKAHRLRSHRKTAFRQLLYMSGLALPRVVNCLGPDCSRIKPGEAPLLDQALQRVNKPLIVDANVVYGGAHNLVHKGQTILVPYCVFYEITARYAESAKGKRYEYGDPLLDTAAYLSLEETLSESGGELVSSPIAHRCEAAIPSIDPVVLGNSILATRDHGAYNLWRIHPSTRNITLLYLDSPDCSEAVQIIETRDYGELFYYLLQYLVLLRIVSKGKIPDKNSNYKRILKISLTVDGKPTEIPYPNT